MLDMGFEKEMNECLSLIKSRCKDKFTSDAGLYHSESIKMNFISATLSSKVQALGAKLMKSFKSVGFADDKKKSKSLKKINFDNPDEAKDEGEDDL